MYKHKKKTVLIISMLLFSSIFLVMYTMHPAQAISAETIIWLCSDLHMDLTVNCTTCDGCSPGDSSWGGTYRTRFFDAVNDTNDIDVDYAFCTGDMLSWHDSLGADTDAKCEAAWDDFYSIWDTLNVTDSAVTIGNHDGYFENYSRVSLPGYSYMDIGDASNGGIRVMLMCDEGTIEAWGSGDQTGEGEIYSDQTDYVNSKVTDVYDSLNIFILNHQRLQYNGLYYGTESWYTKQQSGTSIESYMSNWQSAGHPYDLYAYGHVHASCITNSSSEYLTGQYLGGQQLLVGGMCVHGTACPGYFTDHAPCSRYLYLTEGSTTVTVKSYNHISNGFDESKTFTFELEYEWDDGVDEGASVGVPEFISINGGVNGTSTTDSTPAIVWELELNVTQYHLQIATDSEFTSLVVNLSDINELNYPTHYSETNNTVVFVLPDVNQLSVHRSYYFRVRAKGDR